MKQKLLLVLIVLFQFFINSCGYYISREGYDKIDSIKNFEVYVYRFQNFDTNARKVGSVSLSEGFTIDCSENDAVEILKKEACYANANIVNITKEYFPSFYSDCYRCDADLYIDTNLSVIRSLPSYHPVDPRPVRESLTKYRSMPFNYLFLYFGIEYAESNQNYWGELLNKYNFPVENSGFLLPSLGFSCIYEDYYFEININYFLKSVHSNDSLKSELNALKLGFNFGYNLLNNGVTISPFISFRYFYQQHTILLRYSTITLDQFMQHPALSLRTNQVSGAIGLNLAYPFSEIFVLTGSFGYNLNFHKYPILNSESSNIKISNIQQVKNYFFNIGIGLGGPF